MNLSPGDADTPSGEKNASSDRGYIPPRWALGYHESYRELPTPDALVAVARQFRQRDTPLESLQVLPSTAEDRPRLPETITDELQALDVKTMQSITRASAASPADRRSSDESVSGLPPVSRRPFTVTRSIRPDTPPHAAVSFPVQISDRDDLRRALRNCLELSNRGFPLCGPDLHVPDAAVDPSLAMRWIQLAVFLPLLHVTFQHPRSSFDRIWPFPRRVSDVWRRHLGLRYKLLPYLYTTFDRYRRLGVSPVRELTPNGSDPAGTSPDEQFFLGDSLLIAPVFSNDDSRRPVYLPRGTWFQFWTNRRFGGNETVSHPVQPERIPVFVRGGSVVPLHPYMCQSNSYQPRTLILRTYPDGSRSNEVYLDDGHTYTFRSGDYHRLTITTAQLQDQFSVTIAHDGDRPLPYDHFEWQLPGGQRFDSAAADGRPLSRYDMPEQFAAADAGVFRGHHFLRIRTPADISTLELFSG